MSASSFCHFKFRRATARWGVALVAILRFSAGESAAQQDSSSYEQVILPVIEKYCFDCHSEGVGKGDLVLDSFLTEPDATQAPIELWEKVEQHVLLHVMPPPDKPWPTDTERNLLLQWIDNKALACDCSVPLPGNVTIRRLNRVEYDNTIRDLFDWPLDDDFHPSAEFPQDDTGYGFDNIGDVLTLPPIMLEKYLRAAERVLDRAIITTLPESSTTVVPLESFAGGTMTGGLLLVDRSSEITAPWNFPYRGDFELRVTAFSHKAGNEDALVRLSIGDRLLGDYWVPGTRQNPTGIVRRFNVASPGARQLRISFLNDWDDPDAPDPNRRDRNVLITRVEVAGPFEPGAPDLPVSHQKFFGREWTGQSPFNSQEARAREVITSFATAAFRRPVTTAEVDKLQRLYWLGDREGETFEGAVRVAMTAVLVSPSFLFREEQSIGDQKGLSSPVEYIDEYALTSRLSYFLWSSMPDQRLLALAAEGSLRKHLASEVSRMLADPKSRALTANFAGQWLQLRDVSIIKPDPGTFTEFDPELRASMLGETERFFEYILHENRSVLEFLNADYTFINERLARHYGISGISGSEFQKVSLVGTQRRGMLTQASFLTLTSNPNRTSPVRRGKWIMENILGTPPPPAPQVVPPIERPEVAQLQGSFRKKLEMHRRDSACAGCHFAMDTIGFAFEHFDGIGAWRSDDSGAEIEAAGKLLTGEKFNDAVDLTSILATDRRNDFLKCFTERLLTYSLGRGLQHTDRCAVDAVLEQAAKDNYRFTSFIKAVTDSIPFQMRKIQAP
ncbi:MAG: DUF1592 domain-containing protein [Verrucomicrobiales bacterium]